MWLLTHQKNGASALSLQHQLGLTRYETAWTVLHKLRRAMVRPGRDRLRGTVEVDETYVGGEEEGVRGRETYTKTLVGVAAEEAGHAVGRIRLATLPDASDVSLLPFVEGTVEPGSVVHTDGWAGYRDLHAKGYRHQVTNITRSRKQAHEVMPRVHRVASLLKRWLLGTHQGAVRPLHLDYPCGARSCSHPPCSPSCGATSAPPCTPAQAARAGAQGVRGREQPSETARATLAPVARGRAERFCPGAGRHRRHLPSAVLDPARGPSFPLRSCDVRGGGVGRAHARLVESDPPSPSHRR